MSLTFILSAVWVYTGIMSPFLLFCFAPLIERFHWIASPKVFAPAVIGLSLTFFLGYQEINLSQFSMAYYSHFLIAPVFALAAYFALLKMGYTPTNSMILSVLTVLAVDELWQTPMNIYNWTVSLYGAEVGLATAAWNFMSLPLIFYFVSKQNFRIRFGHFSRRLFALSFIWTLLDTLIWWPGFSAFAWYSPYYLVVPWFLFFIAVFGESKLSSIFCE